MLKIQKHIVLIAVVIVLTVVAYYQYAKNIFRANREGDVMPSMTVPVADNREVSAVVKYMATEDKQDTLRFILTLNKDGVITGVTTLDAETNEVPEKKKPFNEGLSVVIIGKKLSELTAVDKIGTSTYTTTAFNSVIDQLKAQL
ncbi:MAG: FMN-binding protein [Candidatus Moranbacteria bacterium]|nr:FMN-binding protein [Candidatus Moranbacteria bacterium]